MTTTMFSTIIVKNFYQATKLIVMLGPIVVIGLNVDTIENRRCEIDDFRPILELSTAFQASSAKTSTHNPQQGRLETESSDAFDNKHKKE